MSHSLHAQLRKIGQGCFYSALLRYQEKVFHLVYDCGSSTKRSPINPLDGSSTKESPLEKEISAWGKSLPPSKLDMLVISHLDADHVNGLDALLKKSPAKVAFLPYFTPLERLLCALRYSDENDAYYRLLENPAGYLLENGVSHVVYIGRGDEDDRSRPESSEETDRPPENPPEGLNFDSLPDDHQLRSELEKEYGSGAVDSRILCKTHHKDMFLSFWWRFRFFHKEPLLKKEIDRLLAKSKPRADDEKGDARKAALFLDALETVQIRHAPGYPNPFAPSMLLPLIRNSVILSEIKKAYGHVTEIHNDVSLVLWHGPEPKLESYTGEMTGFRACLWKPDPLLLSPWVFRSRKIGRGTLLTGDLDLTKETTLKALIRHYLPKWRITVFFYLPHHGSRKNLDIEKSEALFSVFPSKPTCVCSAGYAANMAILIPILSEASKQRTGRSFGVMNALMSP